MLDIEMLAGGAELVGAWVEDAGAETEAVSVDPEGEVTMLV